MNFVFIYFQGRIQSLERGGHFVEKGEDQKKKEKQNEWRKQQYHYEVKVHNYYSHLEFHRYTVTALLELLTDCSIRVSRSFMTKDDGGGGHVTPWLRPCFFSLK